MKSIYYNTR